MLLSLITGLAAVAAMGVCLWVGFGWHWVFLLPLSFGVSFLGLLVLALLFLLLVTAPLDPQRQYDRDSRFYRALANGYIGLAVRLVGLRFEVKGMEKRPTRGRFLLVCNHLHEIDPAILMHFFPKSQLGFIAKREAADMFLVGKFMPRLLCQYLNRENDREALKTILRCIQLLKEDRVSIGVFPEGGINQQRKFKRFRSGVFKIAQKAQVPVVVCTLQNTQHVVTNLLKGKRTTISVHLLEVVSPEWMAGKTTVEIGDYIHDIMAADLGPENCYLEENT